MRYADLHALVVHLRPYRETSALVQFFTREQGRVVGVMKGLHRGRQHKNIQPFQLGSLSCSGRTGLVTVTNFETTARFDLSGDALSAGFYVLELVTRSLAEHQAEAGVFDATLAVLQDLAAGAELAPCLRRFELTVLGELGYGLDFSYDNQSGEAIVSDGWYQFVDEQGLTRVDVDANLAASNPSLVPGWVLLAISDRDFQQPQVLRAARRLNQQALTPLIGSAPLISRTMYAGSGASNVRD